MRFSILHVLPMALLAAAVAACRPPVSPEALTDGVWVGERGPWVVAVELSLRGDRLAGVAHVLVDGRKWTEAPVTEVELDPPALGWHLGWGALDMVVTVTGGNHANGKLMAIAELVARQLFGGA